MKSVEKQGAPSTHAEEKAIQGLIKYQNPVQRHAEQKGKRLYLPIAGISCHEQNGRIKLPASQISQMMPAVVGFRMSQNLVDHRMPVKALTGLLGFAAK